LKATNKITAPDKVCLNGRRSESRLSKPKGGERCREKEREKSELEKATYKHCVNRLGPLGEYLV
jgi:hypothetical protein